MRTTLSGARGADRMRCWPDPEHERDRPPRMTVHSAPRWAKSEPDSSPNVTLAGPVDHDVVEQTDSVIQLLTLEHDGPIVIDVSAVDEVNGALLGLLLRAYRRLAWRNRELIIACSHPEHSRRMRIAGLDELATLVECA